MNAHFIVLLPVVATPNGNGNHVIPGSSADMAPFAIEEKTPCPRCSSTNTNKIGQAELGQQLVTYFVCLAERCRWAWDSRPKLK